MSVGVVKILHFFKTYWPDSFGGIERVIDVLARGSAAEGIDVEVLSLSEDPNPRTQLQRGHRITRARRFANIASTGFSVDAFRMFRTAAASADIVHYHYPWPFMDLAHFQARHGKPTVVTYHSDIVKQSTLELAYAPLRERFLRSVDAIVATSPEYLQSSTTLAAHRAKATVIPLGLDDTSSSPPSAARLRQWRDRFTRPFFLFIGEFRYYKGLEYLVRAAVDVKADIALMGTGPLDQELRQLAASLKLSNVHFVGRLDDADKAALLTLAEGLILPSHLRSEAFGLALVEAAMYGKAMVSCEIGTGTSYVNLAGKTGIVVQPADPSVLAAAINELATKTGLRTRFGREARNRYENLFTAERMVDEYLRLYNKLIAPVRLGAA